MGNATSGGKGRTESVLSEHGSEIRLKLRSVVDFLQVAHYGANDLTLTEAVQLGFMPETLSVLALPDCNVNENDEDGNTPVMHAAALPAELDDGVEAKEFVEILLKHKANPNWQNTSGNTALHFACENENIDAIILLLQAGANTQIKNFDDATPADLCITEAMKRILEDFDSDTIEGAQAGSRKPVQPTAHCKVCSSARSFPMSLTPLRGSQVQRTSSDGEILLVQTPAVVVRKQLSKGNLKDCCKLRGARADAEKLLLAKADPNEVICAPPLPCLSCCLTMYSCVVACFIGGQQGVVVVDPCSVVRKHWCD